MNTYSNEQLSYKIEDDIAIISINQVNNPTNLYTVDFVKAYAGAAQLAIADEQVKGIIVTSGQRMFMAGGDLRMLSQPVEDAELFFNGIMEMHKLVRTLETAGKPIVAAINGVALGGGFELALTCHHRIVLNNSKIKLGLPESKVGLLPGGGGTAKLPYLMGIEKALTYLLQGKEVRPERALKDGLVNELAETVEELMDKAKAWILANPKPSQPWDVKGYKIPKGAVWSPGGVMSLMGAAGNVSKLTHGNYPAQQYILSVVHDGLQVPIDRALEIEARFFTKVVMSKEARNIIRTIFIEMQKAKKGIARPKGEPKYEINKVGILGAGMMGAGIAYVSAWAGIDVVLKDITVEEAEKGKDYSRKLLQKAVSKGWSPKEREDAVLAKITTTDNAKAIADCDLVIEAVFEDPILKDRVTKETEAVLPSDKVYGSNTSTIPISMLANSSARPENFIGIHFFSPVERMPLLEIIVGEKTSKKAIATAVDYAMQLSKTPIVVNDSRGFFTSRCFGTYVSEAIFLLEEGVPAAMIENIAKKKGMAVGPLAVHDEVSLTLSLHVYESNPDAKKPYQERMYNIVADLVNNYKREGKKAGAGFYDYPKGGKKKLWKGLAEKYNSDINTFNEELIGKRLLHFQALESYRCFDEGVLQCTRDGDLGSVLGWGFPAYTGGAISYIDYVGIEEFVSDCDDFAKRFGVRWEAPTSLRALAKDGKSVHDSKA